MFNSPKESLIIFITSITVMLSFFSVFIIGVVYLYQKRHLLYKKNLEQLEYDHKSNILQSQVEIQQQTFEQIAREIHDNIGQKLTLAKLYLNTVTYGNLQDTTNKIEGAVSLLSGAINDLSDISRGMGTEIILENGLVKALEIELYKIKQLNLYKVTFIIKGTEIFLEPLKELILFRIVQEAINNIIKHAAAYSITVTLNYTPKRLSLIIEDDGKGLTDSDIGKGSGLVNMQKRSTTLHGSFSIIEMQKGTKLMIQIPIYERTTDI